MLTASLSCIPRFLHVGRQALRCSFLSLLADHYRYIVEEMHMQWAADYGGLGDVAQGVNAR